MVQAGYNDSATKDSSLNHPALRVLREFIRAMSSWEQEMIDFDREFNLRCGHAGEEVELHNTQMRAKLRAIYAAYCEAGEDAHRVKDALHYGSESPDYDAEKEQIVSVIEERGKVKIETRMTHNFRFKMRYEMIFLRGKWLIRDRRQRAFENQDNWKKWWL